ncbi:MAG: ABC transporter ATP-binding protein [Nocardioides sp.]|uniref:ABC transporter ATP-binding protein n=1 Tax=Nocardioides sp. TaxID=35761 RepID=UPI0039E2A8A3
MRDSTAIPSPGPSVDPTASPPTSGFVLEADEVTLGYPGMQVSSALSVGIRPGTFTVIVGPNACGKSTLLKALARVLPPESGEIRLDGHDIRSLRSKQVARRISLLPQSAIAPDGITVADLVARGRHPHQGIFQQWRTSDEQAVAAALAATGCTPLAARLVDELSGGQRQRVWLAMLLAQETPVLLLDEPTTFLDVAHQFDLLELLRSLHDEGRTVVAVLHDLNQAFRYASDLIVMKEGRVVATGAPREVIDADLVADVFGLPCLVVPDPITGTPNVVALDPRG